ncbi:MAG: hypothetical protein IPI67_14165 [Myxococcales bacterium]|nr:hypothetical protein [Myxococcales bacterium]
MWIALVIVGAVAALFAMLALIPRLVVGAMRAPLSKRVRARYPDEHALVSCDYSANSFGVESWGRAQLRGNGALALAPAELCFFQYLPERDVVIPLERIVEVSFTRTHLGKATPFRLVKVRFEGDAGADSIAVMVRRPDELRAQIECARASTATSSTSKKL